MSISFKILILGGGSLEPNGHQLGILEDHRIYPRTRGGHSNDVAHKALFKYQGVTSRLCILVQNNSNPESFGYVFDVKKKTF